MRTSLLLLTNLALLPALLAAQDLTWQPEVDPRPGAGLALTAPAGGTAALVARGARASATAAPLVSLLRFNTAGARAKIEARQAFHPVYMGMSEREGHERELLAIRILLQEPGFCLASPRLLAMARDTGQSSSDAGNGPAVSLGQWIAQAATQPDFQDRYLSYSGEGGKTDPDFLLYTTPHPAIASLYGEVVFELREQVPRGVDLNSLNREAYDYYRRLPLTEKLSPRGVIVRALLDRDEYVIPSHVPASDIVAANVHARLPFRVGAGMVRMSGRLQRSYRKGFDGRHTWVDVLDRSGRSILRLTVHPGAGPPAAPRSESALPAALTAKLRELRVGGFAVLMK